MSDGSKVETNNIPGADLMVNRTAGLAGAQKADIGKFQIGGPNMDLVANQMNVQPAIISQDTAPVINDLDSSTADFGNGPEEQAWRKDALEGPNLNAAANDPNKEMDQRNIEEEAARGRMGESRAEKLIRNGRTPSEIMEGVQLLLEAMGDSNIPNMFNDHWTPQRAFNVLYTRWQNLRVGLNDISSGDRARVNLNQDGTGIIADADAADFAIYVRQTSQRQTIRWTVQNINGKDVETREDAMVPKFEYYFGNAQERKNMARACERAFLAFGGRAMLGAGYGLHDSALRDDVNGLATTQYESGPKFTIPQLIELFNLSGVKEIGKNIEDHSMGDEIERQMWWQYAMLHCETRADLEAFLARPATNALIMPSKPGANKDQIVEDNEARTRFLKTMLGDWTKWNDNGRTADTLAKEVAAGHRGPITKHGNMVARGILSYGEEEEYIKTLAELSGGSVESVWVSITMMTVFNIYNRYGAVEFSDGSLLLELGKANSIKADDLAKLHLPTFQSKERQKGNPSGPEDFYRIAPDLAISWFDMAKVKGEIRKDEKGKPVIDERTLENFWLGVPGQVDYHRLGGIDFKSLPKGTIAGFYQMLWLMCRDGDGIISATTDAEPDAKQFSPHFMRRRAKYDRITINAATLKLENKGFVDPSKAKAEAKRIQEDTTRKLFYARKNTPSFLIGVEPRNLEVRSDSNNIMTGSGADGLIKTSATLIYDEDVESVMSGKFTDIESAALKNSKVKKQSSRGKILKGGNIVDK